MRFGCLRNVVKRDDAYEKILNLVLRVQDLVGNRLEFVGKEGADHEFSVSSRQTDWYTASVFSYLS